MPKNIYITATRENQGKTAVTLGLTSAFCRKLKNIGFIKPIGRIPKDSQRHRVDEDTLLIEKVCSLHCNIEDMNPITFTPGFPMSFTTKAAQDENVGKVWNAYKRVSEGKELVVIEGTGHAAEGAVFNLSNALLAKVCEAKVLVVTAGGVGQPVDDVLLNLAYYEKEGVEVLGVVVNKVRPNEMQAVEDVTRRILEDHGVRFFGAIPRVPALEQITMLQVLEETGGQVLHGETRLTNRVGRVMVGAMTAHNAIQHFKDKDVLLVVPGDRDDILLGALVSAYLDRDSRFELAGVVLSGGIRPSQAIFDMMRRVQVPVILVQQDSFTTAAEINHIVVRVSPTDKERIQTIIEQVAIHVRADEILSLLGDRR